MCCYQLQLADTVRLGEQPIYPLLIYISKLKTAARIKHISHLFIEGMSKKQKTIFNRFIVLKLNADKT